MRRVIVLGDAPWGGVNKPVKGWQQIVSALQADFRNFIGEFSRFWSCFLVMVFIISALRTDYLFHFCSLMWSMFQYSNICFGWIMWFKLARNTCLKSQYDAKCFNLYLNIVTKTEDKYFSKLRGMGQFKNPYKFDEMDQNIYAGL